MKRLIFGTHSDFQYLTKNDNLTRDKESLLNKITELSDQIVHQDSKIYDTNGIINQLKDFLSQKETVK